MVGPHRRRDHVGQPAADEYRHPYRERRRRAAREQPAHRGRPGAQHALQAVGVNDVDVGTAERPHRVEQHAAIRVDQEDGGPLGMRAHFAAGLVVEHVNVAGGKSLGAAQRRQRLPGGLEVGVDGAGQRAREVQHRALGGLALRDDGVDDGPGAQQRDRDQPEDDQAGQQDADRESRAFGHRLHGVAGVRVHGVA